MRSGFNTNIRHRGTLFHVQTEDSGRANPHLVTHLFYEGSILASEKQSYSEETEGDDVDAVVKARMEAQHVAMLKRLTAGAFDAEIESRLGPDIFGEAPAAAAPAEDSAAAAPAASEKRARRSGVPGDASLDEMVLDYLAERGPRSPGAR